MKTRSVRTIALLAGALAIVACSEHARVTGDAPPTGRRADAIQGGSADTTSTFAVAVVDDQDGVCSGTLIAPNLVLTARHCVALDDGGATVDCAHDQFSPPSPASSLRVSTDADASFATAKFHATKIIVPTETAFCGHDVALIVLKENVPASVATPAMPALDPPHGTKLTAIGYGISAPNASDDGTRRKRAGIDIACIPGDKTLDCDPADFGMTAAELAAGNGLCDGDSGSGAYEPTSLAAGKPIVIGVLSRAGGTASQCTDAVYGRTDSIAALLIATAKDAAAAGGYAPPAWADPTAAATDAGGADDGGVASEDDAGSAPDSAAASPASSSTTETSSCAMARTPREASSNGTAHVAVMIACAFGTLASRRRRRRRPPSP